MVFVGATMLYSRELFGLLVELVEELEDGFPKITQKNIKSDANIIKKKLIGFYILPVERILVHRRQHN